MQLEGRRRAKLLRRLEIREDPPIEWITVTDRPRFPGAFGHVDLGPVVDLLALLMGLVRALRPDSILIGTRSRLLLFRRAHGAFSSYELRSESPIAGSIEQIDLSGDPFLIASGQRWYFPLAVHESASRLYELARPEGSHRG